MDWKICCKNNLVKEIHKDVNLIHSLLDSSSKKLRSQELLKLDNTTATSKISLTYDALRELLEAIAISKGYKIYNHECYWAFLKEIMNESNIGDDFDRFRKIRNSINYYGKDVSIDEAKQILKEMMNFIKKVKIFLS